MLVVDNYDPSPFAHHGEVFFRYVADANQILIGDSNTWNTCEAVPGSRQTLDEVLQSALPHIAWVAKVDPIGKQSRLTVILSIYPTVLEWPPQSMSIGVDEKILEKVRSRHFLEDSTASTTRVMSWLADAFLCTDPGNVEMSRAAVSYGRTKSQRDSTIASFTLWGDRVVADVALLASGRLHIENLVKGRQKDDRGLSLLRAPIGFDDASQAAVFRGEAVRQLKEITAQADSYLGIWRRYNDLEREIVLRRARERGVFRYEQFRTVGGRFEFSVTLDTASGSFFDKLDPDDALDLDASESQPNVIEAPQPEVPLQEQLRDLNRTSVGKLVEVRRQAHQIIVEHENPDLVVDAIPLKGFLFCSLGGDSKRLKRRDDAEAKIRSGANHMPQLGLLLEGRPVAHGRFKKHKALSQKSRRLFASHPTERQLQSLDVAINTPDIALIQGPPGTGKTQVIAALQARLAELGESDVPLTGQILLTSYQHDAVVQAASRTEVFGLPAVNLSRRKGRVVGDGVEAWKAETVQTVRSRLEEQDDSQYGALSNLRHRVWAHMQAIGAPEKSLMMLGEVIQTAGDNLSTQLRSRIDSRMSELRRLQGADSDQEDDLNVVVRAVRGIQTTVDGFLDDGAARAQRALVRLTPLNVLSAEESELLAAAADWDEAGEPPFLEQLTSCKNEILNRIASIASSSRIDFRDEPSRSLLAEAVMELDHRLNSSQGGIAAVLLGYLSDLENDPDSVRRALLEYTVVLAATCQQADSREIALAKNDSPVFDTVIVDEAARANPLDLLIPMAMAKRRIVLVGDHRQLPQILEPEVERAIQADKADANLDPLRESLFERLFRSLRAREAEDGVCRTVTLDTQFRMHRVLGDFVSKYFYEIHGDPQIRTERPDSDFTHSLPGYEGKVAGWLSVPLEDGRERRGIGRSWYRREEAKRIAQELVRLIEVAPDLSFGIISFYSAQVNAIWEELEALGVASREQDEYWMIPRLRYATDHAGRQTQRVQIGTVDSFQGKEFDVVVLSLTRANDHSSPSDDELKLLYKYGFLTLANRLCVAMSRQRRLLIVAGDQRMAVDVPIERKNLLPLRTFLELCQGNHGCIR